ncbi:MAG: hypothetical protein AB7E95_01565 [Kiritimatiellales bacterium]
MILFSAQHVAAQDFPAEGRWSVGLGWTNEWPAQWRHVQVSSNETVGEWTVSYGTLKLPEGELALRDVERRRADGLLEVRRRWEWHGDVALDQVTLSVRVQLHLTDARPFLPAISYYNNPAGQSVDPNPIPVIANTPGGKGFYEEHRFSMPAAAVEGQNDNQTVVAALHSLPSPLLYGHREDQWWSLGLEYLNNDQVEFSLLSGPVASNGRTGIIKAKQREWFEYPDTWCTLKPGAVVEKTFFIQPMSPARRGAGFEQVVSASLRLFNNTSVSGYTPYREILQLKFNDTLSRWREGSGFAGIDAFPGDTRPWIDLGWAGQSEAAPYFLILLGESFGIPDAKQKAQKAMDFLCTSPFTEDGFSIRYNYKSQKWLDRRNPLSQGQAMNNMLNALRAARETGGMDTAAWDIFLRRACDLHAARILSNDWKPVSTSEAVLIAPLVQGTDLLGNSDYLTAARKAADHYMQRHLSMDEPYWGGTLDARCEDKEGAWACFQGFLAMYDATGEKRYLDAAEHAGSVVLSYMYVWDVPLPPGRLADHAFRTRGWTAVSVQNMHLDIYGVLFAPAFWKLGELTGHEEYKAVAKMLTVPCGQLTDPWGSAGEQIHQTNYAQYYKNFTTLKGVRGDYIEKWSVYWITAHFLSAAAQFKEMGIDCTTWQ